MNWREADEWKATLSEEERDYVVRIEEDLSWWMNYPGENLAKARREAAEEMRERCLELTGKAWNRETLREEMRSLPLPGGEA